MLSQLLRVIAENRPAMMFVTLVTLSLLSIMTGFDSTFIGQGFQNGVSTVAYPFIIGFQRIGEGTAYIAGVFTEYNSLHLQNVRLREEIANMQQRVVRGEQAMIRNAALEDMIDFEREEPRLDLLPAQVVGVERGTLTIDAGSIADVTEGMCVMTPEGIVGVVTAVTPFSSSVMSLHHGECRVAVKSQRSRVRGVLKGSGNRYSHYCELQFIGQHDDVMQGDLLVTSEESRFPAGYPVGHLATSPGSGSLLVTAPVSPMVNPYAVDQVFVVRSAATVRPAIPARLTDSAEQAYAMPDERPIQERFAP